MLLAVLSDTHLDHPDARFSAIYDRYLAPADILLHCGDIVSPSMLHHLMMHPDLKAVGGNMDYWGVREMLTDTVSFEAEGFVVGAVHGWGSGHGLAEKVAAAFGQEYDLVCFGHTHVYQHSEIDGIHVVNPGSVTQPRKGPPSIAYVYLEKDEPIRVEVIPLDSM
ncbi:YfcE family phosphodiesterase [Oceanidesulfovibrio indonesiensis]|uniref:Phosphoesterase n=1 Tax=Oceanidesulfovibrio indonesiensis TaxID=54767 RepID=A0A7M3MCL0_9BACT|nr:metallophosphoesterase [Oceanidesulfovibrio indonesiensis]TVM16194.1 YfcE family phosphodiesterase [Oceanidesulfovibrio indonesiensis]